VIDAAARVVGDEPLATLDYVTVFDSNTLAPLDSFDGHTAGPVTPGSPSPPVSATCA
jgi:hypothetical protein